MKQWYVSIAADQKTVEKRLEFNRKCRTKKDAIDLMDRLNAKLSEPPASEGSMLRFDFPADGKLLPWTIYLNPADYSMINVMICSQTTTDGYKSKIGFHCDADKLESKE